MPFSVHPYVHQRSHQLQTRVLVLHTSDKTARVMALDGLLQRKEVEYALRAIPLGGFVAFPDDDPKLAEKYPKDDPNLLKNRPIKDRALVISAGIIANCIFAFSILCAQV